MAVSFRISVTNQIHQAKQFLKCDSRPTKNCIQKITQNTAILIHEQRQNTNISYGSRGSTAPGGNDSIPQTLGDDTHPPSENTKSQCPIPLLQYHIHSTATQHLPARSPFWP